MVNNNGYSCFMTGIIMVTFSMGNSLWVKQGHKPGIHYD